ncbi:FMN-binding protein [Nonomuraea sediminis]|uniref:FMN-binding protein n=1 Tax=Nonomuraea sediminis TaxID=2835864 RepID=UPI001BDD48ED|nr:FMN-binding protein [Nonomuraea sediminis]
MLRIALAIVVTAVGLVLLLSFKPHAVTTAAQPPAAASSTPSSRSTPSASAKTAHDYTGDAADTRWGPVQVKIRVADGKIADIRVLKSPDENPRDIEISNRALPILQSEALSAQSAHIDSVSGATYTSDGYMRSLQSAIDQAGL